MYPSFNKGKQPCDNFEPEEESYYGIQTHECYKGCKKLSVAFCKNCSRDHHEMGYDNCVCDCCKQLKLSPIKDW